MSKAKKDRQHFAGQVPGYEVQRNDRFGFAKFGSHLPSGKQPQNCGKSPFSMGKLTIDGNFQ